MTRFQAFGDVVRVVRKIAVHFHDELVIAFERPGESGTISAAQPLFLRAVQDVDGGILDTGKFIGQFAGAVRSELSSTTRKSTNCGRKPQQPFPREGEGCPRSHYMSAQ